MTALFVVEGVVILALLVLIVRRIMGRGSKRVRLFNPGAWI